MPLYGIFLIIACNPALASSLESNMKSEKTVSERQFCRKNLGDREKIIACIEEGVYDPCDDAGGSLGRSQCFFAHTEIAERRIKKFRDQILFKYETKSSSKDLINKFIDKENAWEKLREKSCSSEGIEGYGSCYREFTEVHANELGLMLSGMDE